MNQIEKLIHLQASNSFGDFDDDELDLTEVPENPVRAFFERAAFEKAGGPKNWNWDEPITTNTLAKHASTITPRFGSASPPLEKRATVHPDGVEIRELADGDYWRNSYRNGEVVKMELCYANGRREVFDGDGNEME